VLNVKQALGSALVKKYGLDLIKGAVESNPELENLAKTTGLDVTKDLDSVLLSTAGGVDASCWSWSVQVRRAEVPDSPRG